MTTVIVTGGFDPLHSGHIAYFKAAKKLGDKLVVGLNSDEWLRRKKGRPFMPLIERKTIIENLEMVDEVISFNDKDKQDDNKIHDKNQPKKKERLPDRNSDFEPDKENS